MSPPEEVAAVFGLHFPYTLEELEVAHRRARERRPDSLDWCNWLDAAQEYLAYHASQLLAEGLAEPPEPHRRQAEPQPVREARPVPLDREPAQMTPAEVAAVFGLEFPCTLEALGRCHRRLALLHHPGRNTTSSATGERMQWLVNARDYLRLRIEDHNNVPHARAGLTDHAARQRAECRDQHFEVARFFLESLRSVPRRHQCREAASKLRVQLRALKDFGAVLESAERVFSNILVETETAMAESGQNISWQSMWKPHTRLGFDVIGNRVIDYGNVEYATLLGSITIMGRHTTFETIGRLSRIWPTLCRWRLPVGHQTENATEMQGDAIELLFAALRGHEKFEHCFAPADNLPRLNDTFCQTMRAMHVVHAHCVSGWIKYKEERVSSSLRRQIIPDHFQRMWRDSDERARLWAALLSCAPYYV